METNFIKSNHLAVTDNLVAGSDAGLSNRIKCIVSALRANKDAEVYWKQNLHCAYRGLESTSVSDYFSNLKATTDLTGKNVYTSWRFALLDGDPVPRNFMKPLDFARTVVLQHDMGRYSHTQVFEGRHIDFAFGATPEPIKQSYIDVFSSLEINPDIARRVKEFSEANFDSDTVSVHIRSWADAPQRSATLFDFQEFVDIMNDYPESKFFISTDNGKVKEALKSIFGDRILSYSSGDPAIDVFVDLLLVSKNSVIIGSPLSTFTEVAWWFSKCEAEVLFAWKDLFYNR